MSRITPQRRAAMDDQTHPIDNTLTRAIIRPVEHRPARSGLIRSALSAAAVAAIAACVVHVAVADPLGRAFYDMERATIEYCGQC